jgi:hypothetical protein
VRARAGLRLRACEHASKGNTCPRPLFVLSQNRKKAGFFHLTATFVLASLFHTCLRYCRLNRANSPARGIPCTHDDDSPGWFWGWPCWP